MMKARFRQSWNRLIRERISPVYNTTTRRQRHCSIEQQNILAFRNSNMLFSNNSMASLDPRIETIHLGDADLALDCGGVIDAKSLHVRVAIWGNPKDKPTLLICPSLSQNMLAADDRKTERRGWWRHVVDYGVYSFIPLLIAFIIALFFFSSF